MSEISKTEIAEKLKQMIVARLNLKIGAHQIENDQPLFGEGLGLDSVEALEIVVGIEEVFQVRVEDENTVNEFYSINTLTEYVSKLLAAQNG
jgi:acyl carrier protein